MSDDWDSSLLTTGSTASEALQTRKRLRAFNFLFLGLVVVLLPGVVALKIHGREAALRSRGVTTEAVVVGSDSTSDTTYLRVRYTTATCLCIVNVATDNLDAHPVGSSIAVRYDPEHPTHAEALVDSPNPYGPILPFAGGGVGGAVVLVIVVWVARRRKRKSEALLGSTVSTMRVRVEAWQRKVGNSQVNYLSLYPQFAPPGSEPLVSMPIVAKTLAELHADDVFALYGDGRPGQPLALRNGSVTVLPAGRTHSAAWERKHRQPHAAIELPARRAATTSDAWTPPPTVAKNALFADAAEAQAWMRNEQLIRWLLPFLLLGATLRVVPPRYFPAILAVSGLVLVVFIGARWNRRRMLDRFLARTLESAPAGRKDSQAARNAYALRLSTPEANAEIARLLGTTPEALQAQRKRGTQFYLGALGVLMLLFVVLIVRIARA